MPQEANSHIARVLTWQGGVPTRHRTDEVAAEEPLEIRVDTRPVVVTMRTPGHDEDLAAGFLVTEGLIHGRGDVLKISRGARNEAGNVMQVFLAPTLAIDYTQLTRHVFASSSCGLCGKASIAAVHRHFPKLKS